MFKMNYITQVVLSLRQHFAINHFGKLEKAARGRKIDPQNFLFKFLMRRQKAITN